MKRFVIIAVAALALAGCGTTTGVDVDAKIKQVQEQTRFACSFVPTVETVAKIIATFTGGAAAVDAVGAAARGICAAVTTAPLADGPGDRVPRVNGVVVKGRFVR